MIDVNLLPRELTGYVGYVCWQWFERHFSRDEVPYIRGGSHGLFDLAVRPVFRWLHDSNGHAELGYGLD